VYYAPRTPLHCTDSHPAARLAELAGLEGSIEAVHQEGFNRKTGQKLPRRFLQANWRKVRELPEEPQPAAEGEEAPST